MAHEKQLRWILSVKKILSVLIIITCLVHAACSEGKSSDSGLNTGCWRFLLLHGGPIYTMDTSQPTVEAVVISDDGRISYAGNLETARAIYPDARGFDLKGDTLFPGFIEQHLHPFLAALALSIPVIAPEPWTLPNTTWPAANNQREYLDALRKVEAAMPQNQEVLWTWGFNQFFHGDLERTTLDNISDTRPIAVWHRSAHEFYLNSAAIAHFGINQAQISALGPEVSAQVELDKGHFYESGALVYLLPVIFAELGSEARFRAGLKQMIRMLHRRGVTAYNEPGAFIPPHMLTAFEEILGAPTTPMYSFFTPESKTPYLLHGKDNMQAAVEKITQTFGDNQKVRFFDKQIKILFDGAIISQLMQMQDGYVDGHSGEWIQNPREVEEIFEVFWRAGYQIHVHVNGDAGLEQLIGIMTRAQKSFPRQDHRTTIVHFANSTENQVERLGKLGAIISANPYYVTGFSEKFAETGLGPERAHAMVRLADAEKRGMSISLHSDMPMAPSDPLFLAWSAATRSTSGGKTVRPDLALSRNAALRAITIDAAFSWGMEDRLGSIEAGKVANFTVLKQDPYAVPLAALKNIAVVATFFQSKYFPTH